MSRRSAPDRHCRRWHDGSDGVGRAQGRLAVSRLRALSTIFDARCRESFSSQINVQELTFEAWSVPLATRTANTHRRHRRHLRHHRAPTLETELRTRHRRWKPSAAWPAALPTTHNNLTPSSVTSTCILGQIGDDKQFERSQEVQRAAERSAGLVSEAARIRRRQIISRAS